MTKTGSHAIHDKEPAAAEVNYDAIRLSFVTRPVRFQSET